MGLSQTIGRWCADRRWMENVLVAAAHRFPQSTLLRSSCVETAEQILRRDRAAVRVAFTGSKTYLSVPLDSEKGRQIYFFDNDQPQLARAVQRLVKPGQTWLDVNAGLGLFAMMVANTVGDTGKVIVFESRTEMNERLRSSIVLNGATNVTLVPLTAGASKHETTVLLDEWLTGNDVKVDALRVTASTSDVFLGMQQTLKSGALKFMIVELTGATGSIFGLLAALDYLPYALERDHFVPVRAGASSGDAGGSFVFLHKSASDASL